MGVRVLPPELMDMNIQFNDDELTLVAISAYLLYLDIVEMNEDDQFQLLVDETYSILEKINITPAELIERVNTISLDPNNGVHMIEDFTAADMDLYSIPKKPQ